MNREDTINGFLVLKEVILGLANSEKEELFARAAAKNPWYTAENIQLAFDGIIRMLEEASFRKWAKAYPEVVVTKKVGIIMAGNIPLVGFHDLLSVLIAGHQAQVKLSSQDEVLPNFIINELQAINSAFASRIEIVEVISGIDAVIATGSDNSSRYFKKYFNKYPHIIRKNRTSVSLLDGNESDHELQQLARDIFSYFGMGCRNVSKLYIPDNYDLEKLIAQFTSEGNIVNHPKYFNNYEYNKAIYLVNKITHLDNGFALFCESDELVSPLSVVYYQHYRSIDELKSELSKHETKLQCIVGHMAIDRPLIPFGEAQNPAIDDYADNIDTLQFLTSLKN